MPDLEIAEKILKVWMQKHVQIREGEMNLLEVPPAETAFKRQRVSLFLGL
jgi:hypothetical protein